MKGFTLRVNKECISGAINEGITGIIVTYKEGQCHVNFSSMDKSGMLSYTWYAADLEQGDCLSICFENISSVSQAKGARDYNKSQEEIQKESLELYRKLKEELINEGLIDEV
jgi:coenzyme F420-reducing hydrogenase delta subunit